MSHNAPSNHALPKAARWPSAAASHPRPRSSRSHLEPPPSDNSGPQSPDTVSTHSTVRDRPPSSQKSQTQRRCTVTVNESFVRDEVLLNLDVVGSEDIKLGSLVAVGVIKSDADKSLQPPLSGAARDGVNMADAARSAETTGKRYIFVVKDMPKELKARYPTAEVYVAKHIADAFGMKRGSPVLLSAVRSSQGQDNQCFGVCVLVLTDLDWHRQRGRGSFPCRVVLQGAVSLAL